MNDDKLNELLNHLKEEYEQMPMKGSPERMIAQIKKEKRPKKIFFFRKWQVAAVMVVAVGIGAILVTSEMGSKEVANQEANQVADQATIEFDTDRAQINAYEEESADIEAEDEESANVFMKQFIEETKAEIVTMEGMEEEVIVKRINDEYLQLTTYIPEHYELEGDEREDQYELAIFAKYDQVNRVSPPFFTISQFHKVKSMKNVEERLIHNFIQSGYKPLMDEDYFSQMEIDLPIIKQLTFGNNSEKVHTAIIEKDQLFYAIAITELDGIVKERIYVDTEIILKNIQIGK